MLVINHTIKSQTFRSLCGLDLGLDEIPQPEPTRRCRYLRCLKLLLLGTTTVSAIFESFSCVHIVAFTGLCGEIGEGGEAGLDEENWIVGLRG